MKIFICYESLYDTCDVSGRWTRAFFGDDIIMLDLPKTRWKFEASLVKNERPNENGAKSMMKFRTETVV